MSAFIHLRNSNKKLMVLLIFWTDFSENARIMSKYAHFLKNRFGWKQKNSHAIDSKNSEIFYYTTNEQVETESFVVSINKHLQWFQFYYKKKAVDELCRVVDNGFPLFICIDSIRSHRNHTFKDNANFCSVHQHCFDLRVLLDLCAALFFVRGIWHSF